MEVRVVFLVEAVAWKVLRGAVVEVLVRVRQGKADIRLWALAGITVPETETVEVEKEERLRSGRAEEGSERQSACVKVIPVSCLFFKDSRLGFRKGP